MKQRLINILTFLFIYFVGVIGNAQNTVVSGYLPYVNDTSSEVKILVKEYDNLLEPIKEYKTITHNGSFIKRFDIQKPSLIVLTFESSTSDFSINKTKGLGMTGTYILIEPKDSLHLVLPSESAFLPDIIFSGSGAEKQIILRNINNELLELFGSDSWQLVNVGTSNLDYLKNYLQRDINLRKLLNSEIYKYKSSLSENAYVTLKTTLLNFIGSIVMSKFFLADLKSQEIRNIYYNDFKKGFSLDELIDYKNVDVIHLNPLLVQKSSLLEYLVENNINYGDFNVEDLFKQYEILKNYLDGYSAKSRILAEYITYQLKLKGLTSDLKQILSDYFSTIDLQDKYLKQLKDFERNMEANTLSGTLAYNFSLPDSEGQIHTLDQFKRKVVLLDFMFYGCGGCVTMSPKLDEIYEEYKDRDFELVSISVDDDAHILKKGIGKFSSSNGIHLYTAGGRFDHPIIQHYGINAYPTLVLIDKKGNIITSRAPDPRNPEGWNELTELIDNALKKG